MIRLLVEPSALEADRPALSAECAKHLRVVRPKDREIVELFDGAGSSRRYIFRRNGSESHLEAAGKALLHPPPSRRVTLFACITKGSRWDWTVEKATELGVSRIVPVISARTIVRIPESERTAKCARWRRIAEEAAAQSDAKYVPEICEAVDFDASLALVAKTRCFIGALTDPPSPPLAVALSACPGDADMAVFIGPEGDFTADELAALSEIAVPTGFGPTVLRAETAAIFALSVVMAHSAK